MAKVTERYFDLIGSELDATRLKKLVRKDGRKIIRPIFLAKTSNVTPNEFKKIPQEFRCDYEWDSYTRTYYTDGTDVWAKEWRKHSPYWRNPNHPYYVKTSVTGSEIACAYEGSELQKKALALFYDGQTGSTFRSYAETVAKKQGLDMMRDDGSSDVFFAGHCEEASMRIRLEQAWKKRHPEDDVEVISDTGMYTSGYMNPDGSRKYAFAIINPDDAMKSIQKYGIEQTIVLLPYRRNGVCSNRLNNEIQKIVNPGGKGCRHTDKDGNSRVFRVNDPVMQLENNEECVNGEVGTVIRVSEQYVTVEYTDTTVTYSYDVLDELTLAYAMSIHKSQGSEYKHVIMALLNSHSAMLQRNLFYTGITRAKVECTVFYQQKALAKAVRTIAEDKRTTLLSEKMINLYSKYMLRRIA